MLLSFKSFMAIYGANISWYQLFMDEVHENGTKTFSWDFHIYLGNYRLLAIVN